MTRFDELAVADELYVRLGMFLAVFALVAVWEIVAPRRKLTVPKLSRWTANLGIVALNVALVRLLMPAAAIGMALVADEKGWGLLAAGRVPYAARFVLSLIALDLVIYLQHVMVHAIPIFWRLHRVHHADLDYDVTTGARFHPVEILFSMGVKVAAISILGAPVAAVVTFEVLLNATAMFNHGNIHLPESVDRVLRWFVVTPDMHRVHHSTAADEANTNFGFNLPWWDRLFATYRAQPRGGHEGMTIGIETFRDPAVCDRLSGMLTMPFSGRVSRYALGRKPD